MGLQWSSVAGSLQVPPSVTQACSWKVNDQDNITPAIVNNKKQNKTKNKTQNNKKTNTEQVLWLDTLFDWPILSRGYFR